MYKGFSGFGGAGYTQELRGLPSGVRGVKKTLRYMREYAAQAQLSPVVRQLAVAIVGGVPGKDWVRELSAVQSWVRGNVRYTRDVVSAETLQAPEVTVELGHGDCDDQATLVAALVGSIGFPWRFVAIGSVGDYEHVFCEAQLPTGEWVSVETTESVPVGWVPDYMIRYELGGVYA